MLSQNEAVEKIRKMTPFLGKFLTKFYSFLALFSDEFQKKPTSPILGMYIVTKAFDWTFKICKNIAGVRSVAMGNLS